ncbi:MAG TPA: hypothetical protein VJS44_16615 [Pyrinomonadaceae bacterium]|nr:hypothetical protein [Pyrinomonadaceae bacterium]
MKFRKIRILAALAVSILFCQAALSQQGREAPLTNASIVKLVRAGFKENTVISIIRARPRQFDLSPDRLIELKKNGVSEKIILAMLAVDDSSFADEGWSDDPFFKDSLGTRTGDGKTSDGSSTDIFGTSGGSRGRTRSSGGGRGGNTDDTQTTGSASVKILRPPAESGGGATAPKMERTPTLTNNSIIELVEAGFSEGTIIRRIEQSPVEFDLSADKLKELRRRRVTEAIISAMTAAMGDEPTEKRATQ